MAGWVQDLGHSGSSATGTTQAITLGTGVPVGDYVVVVFVCNAAPGASSCADTAGNTYTTAVSETATLPFTFEFVARVTTALVSTNTITVTITNTGGGRAMTVAQYTGVVALSATDQSGALNNVTNTTATATASGANTQAYELVVGGFGMGGATTVNAATGYSLRTKGVSTGTIREAVLFDKIVAAIETSSCVQTWATTVVSTGLIATFKLLNPVTPRLGRPRHGFDQAVNWAGFY